jgi:hypothetical protein
MKNRGDHFDREKNFKWKSQWQMREIPGGWHGTVLALYRVTQEREGFHALYDRGGFAGFVAFGFCQFLYDGRFHPRFFGDRAGFVRPRIFSNQKEKIMNFSRRKLGVWCLGLVLFTMALGMRYLNAQTPAAAPVSNYNTSGYEATPVPKPHHHHKNVMTDNKVPNEGVQPGKPLDGENPTITMVPVGTVAATPAAH